jgi:hypothetical protein
VNSSDEYIIPQSRQHSMLSWSCARQWSLGCVPNIILTDYRAMEVQCRCIGNLYCTYNYSEVDRQYGPAIKNRRQPSQDRSSTSIQVLSMIISTILAIEASLFSFRSCSEWYHVLGHYIYHASRMHLVDGKLTINSIAAL